MLENHPNIESALYPGLPNDAGYDLASKQMVGGFGCLVSLLVKGNKSDERATSLGGVESLVEHRNTVEPAINDRLLRLSVGIEGADDLLADLEQALAIL